MSSFDFRFPFPSVEQFPMPLVAEVEDPISTKVKGRVKLQGTTWPAKWHHKIPGAIATPNEQVIVIGRTGTTLLCVPLVSS
ncbi:MAG: NfeD family protein [Cyanobacteria bacterium P01_F01_bin.150]